MNLKVLLGIILFQLMFASNIWSHGNEDHDQKDEDDGWETVVREPTKNQIKRINDFYLKDIKPIFKVKCLNCHGNAEKLPWYASLPGPKQLIEHDIKEAKEHMDMTNDIPFSGHGTLSDDLESLSKTIDENTMPPWQYLIMHWKSNLNKKEKEAIKDWIKKSQKILNESN